MGIANIFCKYFVSKIFFPIFWKNIFRKYFQYLSVIPFWNRETECHNMALIKTWFEEFFFQHPKGGGPFAQLSPAIILMSGGAHDGGMLQSWLFTSRNQNLVSGKLWRSGFWSYSKFVKWNRVKMAKNGQKRVEIFLGGLTYDK